MKDISHFKFNNDDKSMILEALNKYRNKGIEYQSDISCVDDLLLKLDNTNEVPLTRFDTRLLISALDDKRNELIVANEPRDKINNLILQLIDTLGKFKEEKER